MVIEPTEFDMIALARRGLQALLDEAIAEVQLARRFEAWDIDTGKLEPASEEAKAVAFAAWTKAAELLNRFNVLHPETFEA
ncbi:hypothetical protein [uncultured Methylobacterium sp.]|jgi:hypothetical protein|uniref:hypothetical protein n=1 Tax=uncultured Methylobacterium sp. TaxID=157278 RepID=UPI002631F58B|nr:hypothetical protein [uncultured Methylobacterium sp.]